MYMPSTRKLTLIFFSTLLVSLLSYVSFAYYPVPIAPEKAQVRGFRFPGSFDFLTTPQGASEINSTYNADSVTASYYLPGKCTDDIHFYYETILVDRGWVLNLTEYLKGFVVKEYQKDGFYLQVQTTDASSEPSYYGQETPPEECLLNLVGGRD